VNTGTEDRTSKEGEENNETLEGDSHNYFGYFPVTRNYLSEHRLRSSEGLRELSFFHVEIWEREDIVAKSSSRKEGQKRG